MRFRFRAFGLHLLVSASVLTLVLGTLYLGWYRWPGWYLADVAGVAAMLIAVDLTIGPLVTLMIASSSKPRRVLTRDIAIIATVQLAALVYGAVSLWDGRPLYYAFSENVLQLVQAYDLSPSELAAARVQNQEFVPDWHSLPRWIWAPLPKDPAERERIVQSALSGGPDVIAMPRYFKHWQQGLSALRSQLKRVDDVAYFSRTDKKMLKERMHAFGLETDQSNAMPFTGRGEPLLVVFDPTNLRILAFLAPSHSQALQPQRYLKTLVAHLATSPK